MKVLLTGGFGNVGLSTLQELLNKGYDVTVFDIKTPRNKSISKTYKDKISLIWGDIRNLKKIKKAVRNQDVIIHTAAIIPPLADEEPEFAHEVNVGGIKNILKAINKQPNKPKLIFTSSITVYGDRIENPMIRVTDSPNPNKDDEYAKQKFKCEELIKESKIDWIIFRLTYIVSKEKLEMDPLMFSMPLDTCIEICHTKDVGLALANAVEKSEIVGKILNIGGGENCRIIYRDYIHRMLDLFGLGGDLLPPKAFSKNKFHCGFLDSKETEELLHFQRFTLTDYFKEVKEETGIKRFFYQCFPLIVRPIARKFLLEKSPFYKKN
ncbi:MAG: NAD(P)-dependent oxidoreductase [Candidatus Lokiarchaeota archaeon]